MVALPPEQISWEGSKQNKWGHLAQISHMAWKSERMKEWKNEQVQTNFSYVLGILDLDTDFLSIYFSLYMYIVQVHAYVYTRYM